CHGRGWTRTIESGATLVLRALEAECVRNREMKFTVSVPTEIAAYLLNQKRKQLTALEDTFAARIIVAGNSEMHEASEFKIEREKLPQTRVAVADTATTCYEEENVTYEEPDEEADSAEEYAAEENDNSYSNRRYGGRSRRFRRSNNGRRTDYSSRNKSAGNEPTPAQSEKKSWWKRLLG
ncbi:MAG: hypothetical protein IJ824_02675, partial [Alphaproteobacteria bacterium]|nr:hypothetical protein [Alphaproteobacteria bacterium]